MLPLGGAPSSVAAMTWLAVMVLMPAAYVSGFKVNWPKGKSSSPKSSGAAMIACLCRLSLSL